MPKLSEINEKPEDYMNAVNAFVSNPRGFFVIAGKNGNGKTFTAQAIFEDHHGGKLDPFMDDKFWNQSMLNDHWLSVLREFGYTSYLLEQLIKAPLLVLDDIGTRKPSDAFMDLLYSVANERYEKRKTHGTIITTNLNSQSMREMLGDAFTSRIASGIRVRHDGPDRRTNEF